MLQSGSKKKKNPNFAEFEVLSPVIMKSTVFWSVTLCGSETARRFGGIYRLHIQGRRASQAKNQQKQAASSAEL
jgi:hypothetical protein